MSGTEKRVLKPSAWFTIKTRLIPALTKVFVNICTNDAILPPPTMLEQSLRSIVSAKDAKDLGDYYIPLVLSDIRDDTDKAGVACKVVDCIVHPSARETVEKIPEYRNLLIAVALDQADDYYQWNLSREIVIPNIPSKGRLKERAVTVPSSPRAPSPSVEEPHWKQEIISFEGARFLFVTVSVPKLTKVLHSSATLDIGAGSLKLDCPPIYLLEIELHQAPKGIDIDNAKAQWNIKEKRIIIRAPIIL